MWVFCLGCTISACCVTGTCLQIWCNITVYSLYTTRVCAWNGYGDNTASRTREFPAWDRFPCNGPWGKKVAAAAAPARHAPMAHSREQLFYASRVPTIPSRAWKTTIMRLKQTSAIGRQMCLPWDDVSMMSEQHSWVNILFSGVWKQNREIALLFIVTMETSSEAVRGRALVFKKTTSRQCF